MQYINTKNISIIAKIDNSSAEIQPIINEVYKAVLFSIPFSNLAHFYELNEQSITPKLGLDCIQTCHYLITELEKKGIPAVYLKNETGESGHHAVLAGVPGHYCILDPILQSAEPLPLIANDEAIPCKAYPVFKDENRKTSLNIKFIDEHIFIDKSLNIRSKKLKVGEYTFNISNSFREDPDIKNNYENGYYYNSLENQLMIRILDKDTGENMTLIYPIGNVYKDKIIAKEELYIRFDDGKKIKYSAENLFFFKLFADKLDLNTDQLTEYFMEAVAIYYKNAPENFEF